MAEIVSVTDKPMQPAATWQPDFCDTAYDVDVDDLTIHPSMLVGWDSDFVPPPSPVQTPHPQKVGGRSPISKALTRTTARRKPNKATRLLYAPSTRSLARRKTYDSLGLPDKLV